MVRGRRTRTTVNSIVNKTASTSCSMASYSNTTTTTRVNSEINLLNGSHQLPLKNTIMADEQNCYASPKRKESKFEELTSPININGKVLRNSKINGVDEQHEQQHQITSTKDLRPQKSILKYFQTARSREDDIQEQQNGHLVNSSVIHDKTIEPRILNNVSKIVSNGRNININNRSLSIDLTNDDDDDDDDDDNHPYNDQNGDGTLITNSSTAITNFPNVGSLMDSIPLLRRIRGSGSSENNLFLQEPVLSLNIDKSLNQPSSIKINKVLEVEPIFSSPAPAAPTSASSNISGNTTAYSNINLNGQFNKIVTLNGTSPKRSGSSDIEINFNTHQTNNFLNTDSNSCDSGVVIDKLLELSPTKRRKPTTPHRILCPSPVKQPLVVNGKLSSSSSGRIKNNLIVTHGHLREAQRKHPKSRRRLNTNQSENNSSITPMSPQLVGGVRLTNETIKKLINTKQQNSNSLSQKNVLNSAKNPTAEQNTNNNFKQQKHLLNGHTEILQESSNGEKSDNDDNGSENNDDNDNEDNGNCGIFTAPATIPIVKNSQKIVQNGLTQPATLQTKKKIKDFFPVRRSVRKTKTAVKEEMMRTLEKAIFEQKQEGLKVKNFEEKGRGIIAKRQFRRGEFVVEYIGDLIDMTEANKREKKYALDENTGCYMYYFKHKNQQYCIDATSESDKLGRLVNHSRNGNLMTKVVDVKRRPHLVLIAKDDIDKDEELTYDYGDRSKEALQHHPWLAL